MAKLQPQTSPDFDFFNGSPASSQLTFEYPIPKLAVISGVPSLTSWRYTCVKRIADIVLSLFMTVFLFVPALLIALAVALSSEGPVFYSESRIGQGGRPFRIWKFRTMYRKAKCDEVMKANGQGGTLLHWRTNKSATDPRITPVGRVMRRWSLDELPQILNVLRGDMSLVGPRPVVAEELPLYRHLRQFYLAAMPGLSGLWQVSGRSDVSFAKRAALDAAYVRNWSLLSDMSILLQTVPAVLSRVGAR